MRIAVLVPQLIPSHPAGGQMLKVVQALASEYEFTVFGRIIDESLKGKVQFHRMPIPIVRPRLVTYLAQFWLYGRLFRQLDLDKQFDVVHTIEGSAPFATVATMQHCGAAALALIQRGTLGYNGLRRLYYPLLYFIGQKMERSVVNNPYLKRLIVGSHSLKREIVQHYQPLIEPEVIPNSVDVDRLAQAKHYRKGIRQELGLQEPQLVGAICALGDWQRKGLDLLIEAISLLPRGMIKILVIGGEPPNEYRKHCERMGVADDFMFLGFVADREKFYGFYGAADFFVLPTAYESWSLVSIEAAAAGLPLLVTRASDILKNFVEEGMNGLHIERDPTSIAKAICFLLTNREKMKAMGAEAQRRAQAFRVDRMVDAYRQLYQEIREG